MKDKILIIEDKYDLWKELLDRVFPDEHYEKDLIDIDDQSCLERMNLRDYVLVISDYYLHNSSENGVQWVKNRIKSKDPSLPVIFWTASKNPDIIQDMMIGEIVFFKKQLDIDKFREKADDLINIRRMNRDFKIYNDFFNLRIEKKEYRSLCKSVYEKTARYLESFFAHSKYHSVFNAHGLIHIQNVIDNLATILFYIEGNNPKWISQEDLVAAFISVCIHDLGMMPEYYEDNLEIEKFREIRKNHCNKIYRWTISKYLDEILDIDDALLGTYYIREKIALICLYHDCQYSYGDFFDSAEYKFPEVFEIKNKFSISDKRFVKILAGLVSLADKIDYGPSRVPVGPSRKSNYRGVRDEFEYIKNQLLINVDYSISDKLLIIFNIPASFDAIELKEGENYFNVFAKEIRINNKIIDGKALEAARKDLQTNVIEYSWNKIKEAFYNCGNPILESLNIVINEIILGEKERKFFEHLEGLFPEEDGGLSINKDVSPIGSICSYISKLLEIEIFSKKNLTDGFSGEQTFLLDNNQQHIWSSKDNPVKYKNQKKFLKIGNYDRVHKEVNNYVKYAVPLIRQSSLIGHVQEFKYLDYGCFIGSIIQDQNAEINSLSNIIRKESDFKIKIDLALDFITSTLSIFFEFIEPFSSKNLVLEFYNKKIGHKKNNLKKISDLKERILIKNVYNKFESLLVFLANEDRIKLHSSIIHGDFTFRNVLKAKNDYVFIDFAESGLGHFFYDFAKLEHYLRFELLFSNGTEESIQNFLSGNSDSRNSLDELTKNIWKMCCEKFSPYIFIKSNLEIEFYLAYCYMNVWSMTFSKDYNLSLEKRADMVEMCIDKVNDLSRSVDNM